MTTVDAATRGMRRRSVLLAIGLAACSGDDGDNPDSGGGSGEGSSTAGDELPATTDTSLSATSTSATGDASSSSSSSSASSSSDTGLVTNGCGTFDPNKPGDSVIPQDPDDPEIIAACTALCEALATVTDCTTDAAACLDDCKMRSCMVCPGTIAPLVECETEMFTPDRCTCDTAGAQCPTPDGCSDLLSDTNACGG